MALPMTEGWHPDPFHRELWRHGLVGRACLLSPGTTGSMKTPVELAISGMQTLHRQHRCRGGYQVKARASYVDETLFGSPSGTRPTPPDFDPPWVEKANRPKGVGREAPRASGANGNCETTSSRGSTPTLTPRKKNKYSVERLGPVPAEGASAAAALITPQEQGKTKKSSGMIRASSHYSHLLMVPSDRYRHRAQAAGVSSSSGDDCRLISHTPSYCDESLFGSRPVGTCWEAPWMVKGGASKLHTLFWTPPATPRGHLPHPRETPVRTIHPSAPTKTEPRERSEAAKVSKGGLDSPQALNVPSTGRPPTGGFPTSGPRDPRPSPSGVTFRSPLVTPRARSVSASVPATSQRGGATPRPKPPWK